MSDHFWVLAVLFMLWMLSGTCIRKSFTWLWISALCLSPHSLLDFCKPFETTTWLNPYLQKSMGGSLSPNITSPATSEHTLNPHLQQQPLQPLRVWISPACFLRAITENYFYCPNVLLKHTKLVPIITNWS